MAGLWEWVRERAVEVHVGEHLRERLERGDRLRVKFGMDPTAPDVHVGHLVVLDVLRRFQEEGHTAVLIVGDFTALIGDPSGRSETRPMLTREQVDTNARTYFEQVYRVLDQERTEVHGNAEWLSGLGADGVLRLLATQTLQAVLQREDFASRLRDGRPVGAHEVLYPFNQAYDSVAVSADLELGGTDQLFNLLFAREVQRAYGRRPQDVAVFQLLEGTDGALKMSKSLRNYIGVAEPPADIYGKAMSIPDALTGKYLRLVAGLSGERLAEIARLGPRDAKAALARRLVERLHGPEAGLAAEADWDARFRRGGPPQLVAETRLEGPLSVVDLILRLEWAPSRKKALEQIADGAARIDGERVGAAAVPGEGALFQVGKKRSTRIRLG